MELRRCEELKSSFQQQTELIFLLSYIEWKKFVPGPSPPSGENFPAKGETAVPNTTKMKMKVKIISAMNPCPCAN